MIEESFKDFSWLNQSLKDQLQTARARTEVAEELKDSLEHQVRKN